MTFSYYKLVFVFLLVMWQTALAFGEGLRVCAVRSEVYFESPLKGMSTESLCKSTDHMLLLDTSQDLIEELKTLALKSPIKELIVFDHGEPGYTTLINFSKVEEFKKIRDIFSPNGARIRFVACQVAKNCRGELFMKTLLEEVLPNNSEVTGFDRALWPNYFSAPFSMRGVKTRLYSLPDGRIRGEKSRWPHWARKKFEVSIRGCVNEMAWKLNQIVEIQNSLAQSKNECLEDIWRYPESQIQQWYVEARHLYDRISKTEGLSNPALKRQTFKFVEKISDHKEFLVDQALKCNLPSSLGPYTHFPTVRSISEALSSTPFLDLIPGGEDFDQGAPGVLPCASSKKTGWRAPSC